MMKKKPRVSPRFKVVKLSRKTYKELSDSASEIDIKPEDLVVIMLYHWNNEVKYTKIAKYRSSLDW